MNENRAVEWSLAAAIVANGVVIVFTLEQNELRTVTTVFDTLFLLLFLVEFSIRFVTHGFFKRRWNR